MTLSNALHLTILLSCFFFQFTLSGLLNIIDGLWSSCGEERIIVLTTNDKDKLDPALLRPGRMDVHVPISYCTIDGFKLLATNYLKIEGDHQLYRQIEGLLKNVEVTPAEIAEELLKSLVLMLFSEELSNFSSKENVRKQRLQT